MYTASSRNTGRKICKTITTKNLCSLQQSGLEKWCQESSERFLFSAPSASNPEHFPFLLTSQNHALQQQRLGKSTGWNTKGQILDWYKSLWPPPKSHTEALLLYTHWTSGPQPVGREYNVPHASCISKQLFWKTSSSLTWGCLPSLKALERIDCAQMI